MMKRGLFCKEAVALKNKIFISKFYKILSLTLVLTLFVPNMNGFALWDGYVEKTTTAQSNRHTIVDMNNASTVLKSGGVPSDKKTKTGMYSTMWGNPTVTKAINFANVPRDWSVFSQVDVWMYSTKATNSEFRMVLYCDQTTNVGVSYLISGVQKVDWEGWKLITFLPSAFDNVRSARISQVNRLSFAADGWELKATADTELYIDSIVGIMSSVSEGGSGGSATGASAEAEAEYAALNKTFTAVYDYSGNVMQNGKVTRLDEQGSKVIECGGISMAPLRFFEHYLGAAVTSDAGAFRMQLGKNSVSGTDSGSELVINGEKATAEAAPLTENDIIYVPLIQCAKALGKHSVAAGDLTLIGEEKYTDIFAQREDFAMLLAYATTHEALDDSTMKSEDFEAVKNQYRKLIMGGEVDKNNESVKKQLEGIERSGRKSWESMNKTEGAVPWGTGTSSDCSYLEEIYSHIYNMALAYSRSGNPLHQRKRLKKDIIYALDWAYDHVYGENVKNGTSGNWWYWYIGAPSYLVKTLMLLEPELNEKQIFKYLEPIDALMNEPSMTGSNKTDIAYIIIAASALEEDAKRLVFARDAINNIYQYVDSGDGFYRDGSFIMHNKVPYIGVYGSILFDSLSNILSVLGNTKFEVTNPMKGNITAWIYDSVEPFIYKGGMMSMVKGRGPDGGHSTGVSIVNSLLRLLDVVKPEDAKRIKSMIKYQVTEDTLSDYYNGVEINLIGCLNEIMQDTSILPRENYEIARVYGNMDRVVQQKDGYALGISMSSERIYNYESLNANNMKGWYMGDGMVYLYNDDLGQYENSYWNNVNRYRMPGVTADTQQREELSIVGSDAYLSSQDFVGGTDLDEKYAAAAMQLESFHSEGGKPTTAEWSGGGLPKHVCNLMAKKSWFLFDDEMVALGADIHASNGFHVETTIENRMLKKTLQKENVETIQTYDIADVTASSVPEPANGPENVIDGNFSTRWSAEGEESLQFDLGEVKTLGYIGLSFHSGSARQTIFDLQISEDGRKWTTVFSGRSSGTTNDLEAYDLQNLQGRYVKYAGHGNTINGWNSVTEAKIFPPMADGSMNVDTTQGFVFGGEDIVVNGEMMPKENGYEKSMPNVSWMNIEGTGGYYFPGAAALNLKKTDNNPSFLEAWLDHGVNPTGASYSYVLLPNKTADETKAYAENPDVLVLANTLSVQAVREKTKNITGIVFWQSGEFEGMTASVPMVVMVREENGVYTVSISDPTHKLTEGVLTIPKQGLTPLEKSDRVEVEDAEASTILHLNFEASMGGSITSKFQMK